MSTDLDQAYCVWSHEDLRDREDSRDLSVSQMLDHGSISFGRFAVESLSWERRSVFTHNKCQEELEKFKAPGLVAQKKAYFEEYYKKIRALKAMQENQQTELALDYGGDGSISSQTGEEEESVQLESRRDGTADVIDAYSEKTTFAVPFEQEKKCNDAVRIMDQKPELSCIDSSGRSFEEIEQEKKSSNALQMHCLDMKSTVHESLRRSMEEIKQNDLDSLDNEGIPGKYENSESHFEPALDPMNSKWGGSERSIEEIGKNDLSSLDNEGISRKYENSESHVEPVVAAQGMVLYPTNSDSKLTPSCNLISGKIKLTVKKYKEDLKSIQRTKELAASVRNREKSKQKTKPGMVKSSHSLKYPLPKIVGKAENGIGSSKAAANKVLSSKKSTLIPSHRPLTEVRSNVTIPRPFSLATERRAVTPAGIREGALRSFDSRFSNGLTSSMNHAKGVLSVQGTSKRTAISNGVKSRGLENKSFRGREEVVSKPLAWDSQCTSFKERDVLILPKARSINFPPWNKSDPNGGIMLEPTNAFRVETKKEEKEEARLRLLRGSAKIVAPPLAGSLGTESKKTVRPRTGDLSLEGRKPRREMPRWR